eukprot:scaffold307581_cov33-Tisochrysis_lutea.AAC.2
MRHGMRPTGVGSQDRPPALSPIFVRTKKLQTIHRHWHCTRSSYSYCNKVRPLVSPPPPTLSQHNTQSHLRAFARRSNFFISSCIAAFVASAPREVRVNGVPSVPVTCPPASCTSSEPAAVSHTASSCSQ